MLARFPTSEMAAPDKATLGLLNGLAKREYYGEENITDEFLQGELYNELSTEEFLSILKRFNGILDTLVTSDMNFPQLEAYLTSQLKKKDSKLTEGQASSVMKFWRNHKTRIHDVVVSRNTYSNQIKDFNWRIDMKDKGRFISQVNEPCAIVEFQLDSKVSDHGVNMLEIPQKVRFEVSLEQIKTVVNSLDEIEQKFAAFSKD